MPILNCYVDDATLRILKQVARQRESSPEALAEAAIENACIEEKKHNTWLIDD